MNEQLVLESCGLKSQCPKHWIEMMSVQSLQDVKQVEQFLMTRKRQIQADHLRATAANTLTYLGYLTAGLYYLSVVKGVQVTPRLDHLSFIVDGESRKQKRLFFYDSSVKKSNIKAHQSPLLFIEESKLFINHLCDVSRLPLFQAWGIYSTVFRNGKNVVVHHATEKEKENIQKAADWLESIPPSFFHLRMNPFQFKSRYVPSWRDCEEMLPVKTTCCLNYETGPCQERQYCYLCPKIKKKDREKIGQHLRNVYQV